MVNHNEQDTSVADFRAALLQHLQYTVGKDPQHATIFDWRLALSHTLRDQAVNSWFASTRRTWDEDLKVLPACAGMSHIYPHYYWTSTSCSPHVRG